MEGTGIGLVIVKRIVEAMGGNIGFASAEGQGSTFWVEFPIDAEAAPPFDAQDDAAIDAAVQFAATLAGPRVLVAEDNPINQKLTVAMLRCLGYAADVASNGEQTVAALATGQYAAF